MNLRERCIQYGVSIAIAAQALLGYPRPATAQEEPKDIKGEVSVVWGDAPIIPFGQISPEIEFVDQTQILIDGKEYKPDYIYVADELKRYSGQKVGVTNRYVVVRPNALPFDSKHFELPRTIVDVQCNTTDALSLPSDASMHGAIEQYFNDTFGQPALKYLDSPQPIQLDKPKNEFKQPDGRYDLGLIARTCIQAYSERELITADNINLFLPADMTNGSAYGTDSLHVNINGKDREFAVSWFPSIEWVLKNRSVLVHEIGHEFGWPHAGDELGTAYKNPTSIMGDPWFLCDANQDKFGCIPQGPRNFNFLINGLGTKLEVAGPSITNFVLKSDISIVSPLPSGASLVIECLRDDPYDKKLLVPGCVANIYRDDRTNPAWILSQDGKWHFNDGDGFAVEDVEVKLNGQTVSVVKRRQELNNMFFPMLEK